MQSLGNKCCKYFQIVFHRISLAVTHGTDKVFFDLQIENVIVNTGVTGLEIHFLLELK